MIENEIYCCINGFLKGNSSKKTSCVVEKKITGKIDLFNLSQLLKLWTLIL